MAGTPPIRAGSSLWGPMALSPDQVLRLLSRLEIPDCACQVRMAPLCVFTYGLQGCTPKCIRPKRPEGCEERASAGTCNCKRGSCDCARWPQDPPCSHVLAVADSWPEAFTFDDWIEWLESIDPQALAGDDLTDQLEEGYRDARPTLPDAAVTRPERVALLAQRHKWRESLRHHADVLPESAVMHDVGIEGRRLRNGRDSVLGLLGLIAGRVA